MIFSDPNKKSSSRPISGPSNGIKTLVLLLFFLSQAIPTARAQSGSSNPDPYERYATVSPTMAIVIVVMIAALFLLGFFCIYIRHCHDGSGSVRATLSLRSRRAAAAAAARGLDSEVIETFPTFVYSDVKGLKIGKGVLECAVCLNEFEDHETLRLIPKCDHVFHPECIDAWLESHVTCPVCRANLVPVPGESVNESPPGQLEPPTTNPENAENNFVVIQLDAPEAVNRPVRSSSVREKIFGSFAKFRSHSTGHSLVQPGENTDRFTLRLPEDARKEMMNRAAVLAKQSSSRRGNPTGEGSSRGKSLFDRMGVRSDRWVFSRSASFFSRALSMKSPKVSADNGESSMAAGTPKGVVKMSSFKCLEPVSDDSSRPPV